MSEETKDLYKLIGDYQRFTLQVLKSLEEGNTKFDDLDKKITNIVPCPAHSFVMQKLAEKDEKDTSHDEEIESLKTNAAVQEVKLSKAEKTQLNLTTVGTVLGWAYTGLKILLSPWITLP